MLIKEEITIDGVIFIRTYSDKHCYIRGGDPVGLYEEALDLKELHMEYEETDIPIDETDEATEQDYQNALEELGVIFDEEG